MPRINFNPRFIKSIIEKAIPKAKKGPKIAEEIKKFFEEFLHEAHHLFHFAEQLHKDYEKNKSKYVSTGSGTKQVAFYGNSFDQQMEQLAEEILKELEE